MTIEVFSLGGYEEPEQTFFKKKFDQKTLAEAYSMKSIKLEIDKK